MTETTTQKSLVPHFALGFIVIIVVLLGYFLFSGDEPAPEPVQPVVNETPVTEPEPLETEPEYAVEDQAPEIPEPEYVEPEPMPEPLDTSDATVKTAVLNTANYEAAASLLVNEDLLRRFVVMADNTARKSIANNHRITVPPEQAFRVYEQSGKTFVDASSYKRYTPYVEALDSIQVPELLEVYSKYKPAIRDIYAEIGDPDDNFDFVLIDAINHLLDTPEVPVPVEVYTDSVMYKYKDERLEALSGPQKQLLRTGPENMRRIKAKLREIKDAMQP